MNRSVKLSEKKAGKLLHFISPCIGAHEEVEFVGYCMNSFPSLTNYVVTDRRVLGLDYGIDFTARKVRWDLTDQDIVSIEVPPKAVGYFAVRIVHRSGTKAIKFVPAADFPAVKVALKSLRSRIRGGSTMASPVGVGDAGLDGTLPSGAGDSPSGSETPQIETKLLGDPPTGAALWALDRMRAKGERPWLVVNPVGSTGILAAFEDRLAIVKAGVTTGRSGGGREAVFYFRDITAIRYSAGRVTGVLEVIAPGFSGELNKDSWRTHRLDVTDPFVASNALPLAKAKYDEWISDINELRHRISASKHVVVQVASPSSDIGGQLEKIGEMHAKGLLTDDEFVAAKARILNH